jgi:hypothetical protein
VVRSTDHCCRGKAKRITYSECVCLALVIQQAVQMRCIIFSSVVCPAIQYFFALSHKWHDFRRNVTEHKMSFDILYNSV